MSVPPNGSSAVLVIVSSKSVSETVFMLDESIARIFKEMGSSLHRSRKIILSSGSRFA